MMIHDKFKLYAAFMMVSLALVLVVWNSEAQTPTYHEAPMLAERVAAGELPPVEERLPKNPRVLPVYDEIGQYGGTWRRTYAGLSDRWGPTKIVEERIIEFYMPDAETIRIEPNWADRFEPNIDASEFTAHIREGLRWSDGVEVTTEDVRFWYEDIFLNEEFGPMLRDKNTLMVAGELVKVDIIDRYTFTLKFAASYPLFPMAVVRATPGGLRLQDTSFLLPAHYLKQFHPTYASQAELDAIAAEYGVDSWQDVWGYGPVQAWWRNPDVPVLTAWKITVPPPADQIVMERNPYYHAVDAAGNQLPYIDEITHDFFDVIETMSLWVIQGLIDLQSRHISDTDYTLYKRNEGQGNYRVVTWKGGGTESLFLNLNTPDKFLAALFGDSRFRQALSIGIDRHEMNEILYSGLGEPRQASPVTGSPHFDAEFERKWTDYDPERANALLDELGFMRRNAAGFRIRPDGDVLQLTITATVVFTEDTLRMVQRFWEALGIHIHIKQVERSVYEDMARSGNLEVGVWIFDRNVIISADPRSYLGTIGQQPWAPLYAQWYESGGQRGIEPPADHPIRHVWTAWEQAKSASTEEEASAFVRDIINLHKENVWVIGLVGEQPRLYIVSNTMRNFPPGLIGDDALRDFGLAQPAQLFFKEPNEP